MRTREEGMKIQEQATKEVRIVELFLNLGAPMIDVDIGNSSISSVQSDGGKAINLIMEQTMEAFGSKGMEITNIILQLADQ